MEGRDKGAKQENVGASYEMVLTDRRKISMSGVNEVVSFNEKQVQLETVHGPCIIAGEDLNIQKLNLENGQLEITGVIVTISYEVKGHKSFINRMFK